MSAQQVTDLVERIKPQLAGKSPEIQGAALADLLSIWLSGHAVIGDPIATNELRDFLLEEHIALVRRLMPINDKITWGKQ